MRVTDVIDNIDILNHKLINSVVLHAVNIISDMVPNVRTTVSKDFNDKRITVIITSKVEAKPDEINEVANNFSNVVKQLDRKLSQ